MRTQIATGWDAGKYWSTIYPWLASDLTFPGAILFMALVGWWLARWWVEATYGGDRLAMLLFAEVMLLIAFVPANNQIGISRPNTIGALTLLVLYALSHWQRRLPDRSIAPNGLPVLKPGADGSSSAS